MFTDPKAMQVGRKAVEAGKHQAAPVHVMTIEVSYPCTPAALWSALTEAQRIAKWFLPVTGEFRIGGTYQLTGHAGGTITGSDPQRSLEMTWEFGGNITWLRLEIHAATGPGPGTMLRLIHTAPVTRDHWETYGPGATGVGWDMVMSTLGRHLATGEDLSRTGVEWAASEEGHDFVRASSADWARASITLGTPEEQAFAAARRTTDSYLGTAS